MYELFILGELKEHPMHGYLLHHTLSQMMGPLRQMSWGTLYPILRKMEEDGYIRQTAEDTGVSNAGGSKGRPRKVYELTRAGESEFYRLMAKPFEHNSETEDLFRIKIGKFMFISKDMQLDILRQFNTFLEVYVGLIEEVEQRVKREPIADEERPHILNVIDYEHAIVEAKIRWVKIQLARYTVKGGVENERTD